MRFLRILTAGFLVALACLALSGCVGEARDGPTWTASPTVTSTSLTASPTVTSTSPFASNDEALAAAVLAFQRYLDVGNELGADPTTDLQRIAEVATGSALERAIADGQSLRDRGIHQSGPVTFDSPIYEYGELTSEGKTHVSIYACIDLTHSRLVGPDGSDATPAARDDRIEWKLDFLSMSAGSADLILDRTNLWNLDGRC